MAALCQFIVARSVPEPAAGSQAFAANPELPHTQPKTRRLLLRLQHHNSDFHRYSTSGVPSSAHLVCFRLAPPDTIVPIAHHTAAHPHAPPRRCDPTSPTRQQTGAQAPNRPLDRPSNCCGPRLARPPSALIRIFPPAALDGPIRARPVPCPSPIPSGTPRPQCRTRTRAPISRISPPRRPTASSTPTARCVTVRVGRAAIPHPVPGSVSDPRPAPGPRV